jgi:hypothetical protein
MKVSDSWKSLLQGVSQQIPEVRFPGQHTEQVNMVPDPVKGLARRHGSELQGEVLTSLLATDITALTNDTANFRSFEYSNAGVDYVILYRTSTRLAATMPPVIVYNKTAKAFLPFSRPGVDADLDTLSTGGISSITSIGRYVYFAGNTIVPTISTVNKWADATNQGRAVLWVRGGAYNKKYSVRVTTTANANVAFEYTTPSASYDVLLDTSKVPVFSQDPVGGTQIDSEIVYLENITGGTPTNNRHELIYWQWNPTALSVTRPLTALTLTNSFPAAPVGNNQYYYAAGDRYVYFAFAINTQVLNISYTHVKTVTNPNYTRGVNDLVNAYNQALNAYLKTAAAAVEPEAIAEQLRLAAITAGVGGTIGRSGTTVTFTNVKGIDADDDGDDTLLRGVAAEVTSIDRVSNKHFVDKVVRVRARNAEESFYMKALATDVSITSGIAEVTWVEAAGTEQSISRALCIGTVNGGSFHTASTAAALSTLTGLTVPSYITSSAGDTDSNSTPFFVGNKISYLGVFQDRLLIGSGGVIRASRVGDYLNFFRTTVLTVPADDALEFLSEASESDELRYSVLYDQNLVLFGRLRQYAIDARTVLSAQSANMPAMSTHAEAGEIPPVASGSSIFYGKNDERAGGIHEIQPGRNANSPESYESSSQLDDYMLGKIIELKVQAKPSTLFVRTTAKRNDLFLFNYLDESDGRKQSAWHRWTFDPTLGPIIGMVPIALGMIVFFLRVVGSSVYFCADLCKPTSDLSLKPYFDSQRTLAVVEAGTGSVTTATTGNWKVAIAQPNIYRLLGDSLANRVAFKTAYPTAVSNMVVGILQESYVTQTNPFVKDRNDVTITTGELTIQTQQLTLQKSSGYIYTVTDQAGTFSIENNGRIVGDPNNIVGQEVVTNLTEDIGIGRETRDYTLKIAARTWLPLTVTRMEWVGQFFNRPQRGVGS